MTTATEDGKEMFALCVDLESGQVLRKQKMWDVPEPAFCNPKNSYASPTPCIEEGRVYVHFGSYGTACLDTRTGQVLWSRRDLPCDHFRGPASSPILYQDLLILTFDGYDYQYVAALDKKTGATVWKKDRDIRYAATDGDYKKAYGTPNVFRINGRDQLLSSFAEATISYDPATGEELWVCRHGGMNTAATPLYDAGLGLAFLNSGYGGDRLLAVRPDGQRDVTETHVAWRKTDQSIPTRSSPILMNGLLFMVSDDGIASCVDGQTGEQKWQVRIGGSFSASPVEAGGRIYFFSEEGPVDVIAAEGVLKKLARNSVPGGCMASPAVVGNALIVRSRTHLMRIEVPKR
jgi:outer membrane protein assembly factor BamB